jgi:hypothetical protein
VKNNAQNTAAEGRAALLACLAGVPFLKVVHPQDPLHTDKISADLVVAVRVQGRDTRIVAEVRSNGQPRVAREAVNTLLRYKNALPGAAYIFIAPYISEKAAAICRAGGVGYVDLSGNCWVSFDTVYIEKSGYPNQLKVKRTLRSLYSPKAERILRVLLSNPGKQWKTQTLADESGVSLGQVSNVKKQLYDRELVSGTRGGFALVEPEELLQEWAGQYDSGKHFLQEYYSLKGVGDTERELADWFSLQGIPYALTGFSGAARISPAVRYNRVMLYAEKMPDTELAALSLKPVDGGGNVRLYRPYDEGVFYGAASVDGIRIASTVQLYLDLIGFRGRGEEAAAAIYERIMANPW